MADEICAINIGPNERAKRTRTGWIMLILAAAITAVLLFLHAPRLWSAVIFLSLFLSGLGFFQAHEKT